MDDLKWERDGPNDTWTGDAPGHKYTCMRTCFDVAVLYHNNEELRRSGSDGGHSKNRRFAEEHFAALRERVLHNNGPS